LPVWRKDFHLAASLQTEGTDTIRFIKVGYTPKAAKRRTCASAPPTVRSTKTASIATAFALPIE
jgi:hypothetical protein